MFSSLVLSLSFEAVYPGLLVRQHLGLHSNVGVPANHLARDMATYSTDCFLRDTGLQHASNGRMAKIVDPHVNVCSGADFYMGGLPREGMPKWVVATLADPEGNQIVHRFSCAQFSRSRHQLLYCPPCLVIQGN